jgi:hypothetical protein
MNIRTLQEAFRDFTVFSIRDIRRLDPSFHRRRLTEWQAKGYIRKVIKGHYILADRPVDESALFEIANRIYRPSYISLESALAHYQLIPESAFGVTSVSTRRSYLFSGSLADFRFRTVKPDLFFGYEIVFERVLDFLYLNPGIGSPADFESLRLDFLRFRETVSLRAFTTAAKRFPGRAFGFRADRFLAFIRESK